MMQKTSKCRGCGRPIIFVKTIAGKQMPCDPRLVPFWRKAGASGKIVTIDGEVVSCELDGPRSTVSGCGYVSHFSTCPNGDVFRRKK